MTFPGRTENSTAGGHFYFPYRSAHDLPGRLQSLFQEGPAWGFIVAAPDTESLLRPLFREGEGADRFIPEAKDLRFLSPGPAGERGTDPFLRRMLRTLEERTGREAGHEWILLEGAALFTPRSDPELLARFEGELDSLSRERSLTIVCLYDEEFFPFPLLQRALLAHQSFFRKGSLIPNPLYELPPRFDIGETPARAIRRFQELLFRQEESTRLHRILAEKSFAGVYVVQHGRFRYINPNAASYAGYSPEEMIGMDSMRIVLPEDREILKTNALGMMRGTRTSPYEFRILRKDGKVRWILETLTPILFEGKPAILGNSMDITERNADREALRDSEQRMREIVNFLPDATLVIDREGNVITWNRAIEEMTGIPAGEMLGKKNREYSLPFHGRVQPILIDFALAPDSIRESAYTKFEKRGSLLLAEMDYLSPQAEKRFLWLKASPIYDRAGAVSGAIETIRDITEQKRAETLLRIEKARMEELFEGSPEAIALADPKGRVLRINQHFTKLFGYTSAEACGRPVDELIVPPELPEEAAELTRLVAGGTPLSLETVRQTKNGVPVQVSILATPIRIDEDQIGIYAIYRDISERKRIETALRESEERYRTIIETIEDGYYETDLHGRISFANDSLLRILACPREELIGTSFRAFADRESAQRLWLACRKVFDTGAPCMGLEWVITRKGGEIRSLEVSISLIRDARETPTGFRGILRDITERIRSEETIRKLAYHDALTGLPNRFLFHDRLSMAMARAARSGTSVAVIMLDLDKFKEVNDSLGHTVGDLLLKAVSERLVRIMRRGDTVARMGGDEFMIIATDIKNIDGAGVVGKKIVEAVRNPFDCDGRRLSITTSLGIALFSEHGTNPETLVQRADIAMYRAKHLGRDRWKFYEED